MHVAIEAVPGAGKTRRLLRLCADGVPTLVLAYNTQLAAEVQRDLPDTAVCYTFHGLCGACLQTARDDAQLQDAVERAERGDLVPHDVPEVSRLLIDEAQDVRGLYVRLVRVLGYADGGVALVIAGDRNQLVYDFDEQFPATLDTLLRPEAVFGGTWTYERMDVSHRLSPPIATFVNAVFGTSIRAANADGDHAVVEVHAPKTPYKLFEQLRGVLTEAPSETLLLVHRRAGNRPLRALLNQMSRHTGVPVHVHGVDGERAPDGALRCLTYWSAKGLESDTAVVLLPGNAPRNPTYVALTRARKRLVVVLDPTEPHAAVCNAVAADLPSHALRGSALKHLNEGVLRDVDASLVGDDWTPSARFALDRWVPPRALLRGVDVRPVSFCEDEGSEEGRSEEEKAVLERMAVAMAVVACEWRATGSVRAMENVLQPTRLATDRLARVADCGFVGRAVPLFATDDALLADDLRAAAVAAYGKEGGAHDLACVAEVALATVAWDDLDHRMRQMRPVDAWLSPSLATIVEYAASSLPVHAEFDTRLFDSSSQRHVRVHATTSSACFHVVYGRSSTDEASAAVRAWMHPRKVCVVVDLADLSVVEVDASAAALGG